jgi:alkylation response protein AidB-like acyl-CoA dehydrogenase
MDKSENTALSLLRNSSREFARKLLAPNRAEHDRHPFSDSFQKVLARAFELGFFHVHLPEALGGMGPAMEAVCTLISNLSEEDAGMGAAVLTNALAQEVIMQAGGEAVLDDLAAGAEEAAGILTAFAAHADPLESRPLPKAREDAGRYLISGRLSFVGLANVAARAVVPAEVEGASSYCFFKIETGSPGWHSTPPVLTHGLRTCPAADLVLEDAPGILIGRAGEGRVLFQNVLNRMQLAAAALSCGIMRGSWKEAYRYSKGRMQGGRRIRDWSELRMILASMAAEVYSSEMLLAEACRMDRKRPPGWEKCVSAAALQIQSAAVRLASDGIQVLGGAGYMKDFGQEKRFRDAGQAQSFLGIAPLKKLRFLQMVGSR